MIRLWQDVHYAIRSFSRAPAFALIAVLSLATGIGANTSVFAIADALLFHPLPYKDADRLVILWNRSPGLNITEDWFSTAQYFDIKNGHAGFEQLALAIGGNSNLTGDAEPDRVGTIRVSSNLLPMLGVHAAMGRLFVPDEDVSGHSATAVLTYGLWQRRFGSDPQILGKSILIDGSPCEVVGVTPRSFSLPREVLPTLDGAEQADILLPLPLKPGAEQVRAHEDYNIMGKLKPGVSVVQAQAEMSTITARLRRDYPSFYPRNGGLTFGIVSLLDQVVGDVRRTLWVFLGAVGFVLLIACANVANLMLSRAASRQKELAVRAALGAGRWRIARQLLTESVLLALAGGALGIVFCFASVQAVRVFGAHSIPRLASIEVNGGVLFYALILSFFTGVLFGLAPVLHSRRRDVYGVLKESGRGAVTAVWGRRNGFRRLMVVAELSLCVVLLIGAGLLIRSFARLQDVSPGFNPHHVLTLGLSMAGPNYKDSQRVLTAYRELRERLETLPGVKYAGAISALPLSQMYAWGPMTVEGRIPPPGEDFVNVDERFVSGHYFEAMEIPLLEGRLFSEFDAKTSPKVTVIDESMAREFWPGQNPLGKRIHFGGISETDAPWVTVIGVVGHIKQYTLDSESRIALYLPQTQYPLPDMNVVVKSDLDAARLTPPVKKIIAGLDSQLPVYAVKTMDQRVADSLARRRFSMLVLGGFAGVALLLAAVGIYGVLAYLVSQGTRDMGIRMALGATRRNILSLVLWQGMFLALTGVALGLAGAFVLTRLMSSLLFGISASDPLTFVAISVLLAGVALLASYVPARRAAHVDPMVSLRCE